MKISVFSLLFASLLMTGATVTTSCSGYDEEDAPAAPAQNSNEVLLQDVNNCITMLNQQMAGLNFEELAPLATYLKTKENAKLDSMHQKFNAWLQQLLLLLNQDFSRKVPYGFTVGFGTMQNALSTVWSVSGNASFGREAGNGWVAIGDTIRFSADYAVSDTCTYHVTLDEVAERDAANQTLVSGKQRILTIAKGEEQLLSINTTRENEAKFVGFMPSLKIGHTGEIAYKEYLIGLGYGRSKLHNRTIELSVAKDGSNLAKATADVADNVTLMNLLKHDAVYSADYNLSLMSDMILLDGKVLNVNKLIAYATAFLGLRNNGGSEKTCTEFAKLFNENMSANMSIAGNNVGTIVAGSTLDEKKGKHVPSFFIISPLSDNQPMDLNTLLGLFGFSFDDIINIIKGGGNEEGK